STCSLTRCARSPPKSRPIRNSCAARRIQRAPVASTRRRLPAIQSSSGNRRQRSKSAARPRFYTLWASMRRDLLILLGLVLLIRLPFIAQPIQGDDVFYLIFANNALADPLHPLDTSFRLQGEVVWGAGHTRPPGVAWTLAALLALVGGVRET